MYGDGLVAYGSSARSKIHPRREGTSLGQDCLDNTVLALLPGPARGRAGGREDGVSQAAAASAPLAMHRPRDEYEIKFAVPPAQAHVFIAATSERFCPKVYDESLPIAFSRTTYLDTPNRRYLASSDEPVSRRLRIREYAGAPSSGAPARLTSHCFLEYKESMTGQRSKARVAVADDDIADILQNPEKLLARATGMSAEAREAAELLVRELDGRWLSPQLTTWYRRQSLVDADERVRVTLDTEIAFCQPIDIGAGREGNGAVWSPERVAGYARTCLVEVKYQGMAPDWLTEAMSTLGEVPAARLSKYAMGMRALYGAA